jgi:REP element-mobilizing transposase RayT
MEMRSGNCKTKIGEQMEETHTLSHTTWNCKYHIVFAPKYRRKVFYAEKRLEIGAILRQLCKWKGVTILEAEVCPDHVHMLVEIPPKYSVSQFMGYLKGKSSLMIYEKWGNMKYRFITQLGVQTQFSALFNLFFWDKAAACRQKQSSPGNIQRGETFLRQPVL